MQTNPLQDRIDLLNSLVGIAVSKDITLDEIRQERLKMTGIWNNEPHEVSDDSDELIDDLKE